MSGELAASRRRAGLTQEELAERTGLSVRSISNLERGVVDRPRRASLEAISAALELDAPERHDLINSYRPAPAAAAWPPRPDPTVGARGFGATAHASAHTGCPAQLPADNQAFTGRDNQLLRLDDLVAHSGSAVSIALIHGAAGVGKSALALHWAHAVRSRFPDGQLYANLSGFGAGMPADPGIVLMNFLRALGVELAAIPPTVEARAALFRSRLAGRRLVLVLDDARNPAQVRPLLPGLPGCFVIVTSRSRMRGLSASHGARRIALDPLTSAEGTALLMRLIGSSRAAAEPGAVVEILDCCAGLPLALAVVAERVSENPHRPLSEFAPELVDVKTRLDRLATPDDEAAKIRSVMSWSYDALSAEQARVFRMLATHPGPSFVIASAATMLAVPVEELRPVLDDLVGVHLLEQRDRSRFEYHQLTRLYAAEKSAALDPDADRRAALDRIRAFYLDRALRAAADSVGRRAGAEHAVATTEIAATAVESAVDAAAEAPVEAIVESAADAAAVGDFDAWDVRDRSLGTAHGAHQLGMLLRGIGGHDAATRCFEEAICTIQNAGDLQLLAIARGELGLALLRSGKVAEAAEALQAACVAAEHAGDRDREGYTLASLGNTYRLLGRRAAARECLVRARTIAHADALPTLAMIVDSYLRELGCAPLPTPVTSAPAYCATGSSAAVRR